MSLDPLAGISTTGITALRLGRTYVGIDIDPTYHDLAIAHLHHSHPPNPPTAGHRGTPQQERQ